MSRRLRLFASTGLACIVTLVTPDPVLAQSAPTPDTGQASAKSTTGDAAPLPDQNDQAVADIVVTAERRSRSVNSVGMSITATSGDALQARGLTRFEDLVQLVPSLNIAQTILTVPVYTIRGIGFYDTSVSSNSTVSVYTDEIPLPFPAMTTGGALDLERVEVLKGPQGTLYGGNSTGGAINYISAKPTDRLSMGGVASFGRFARFEGQAYISGPLSDTLKARIAVSTQEGGDWQYSYTTGKKSGVRDKLAGRVLLQWDPDSKFTALLNLNGWRDKSDSQFPQAYKYQPLVPSVLPLIDAPTRARILGQALAPYGDARATDFPLSWKYPFRHDDRFYQTALRMNYKVSDALNITSLTAYDDLLIRAGIAAQGTSIQNENYYQDSTATAFTQELRISGDVGKFRYILGANYQWDRVRESDIGAVRESTIILSLGLPRWGFENRSTTRDNIYGVFGNLEFQITPELTLQGGVRYADSKRDFRGCTADDGTGQRAAIANQLSTNLNGSAPLNPAGPGDCTTLNARNLPGEFFGQLNEDNVSWRGGLTWKGAAGTLLYANVSRGYKQGAFPTISASAVSQFTPATQESLLAYEVGIKQPLFDRRIQFNAAGFYYDYSDKQVLGRVPDVLLGSLQRLINIPKSRVIGAEVEITARPFDGLALTASGTYIDSKIRGDFLNYDNFARLRNFGGEAFPFTSKYSGNADAEYGWALNDRLKAFVGASGTYNSKTNAALGELPELRIKAYALLDLRAGVSGPDDRWRAWIWGKNVTNTFYWTNAYRYIDFFSRFTGQPVTYGASVSFKI